MQKQEFCTKPQIEGITDDFLSHPDGQIFDKAVKAGDLRTANYVLQTRLSTDARIPLVKEYISNTELGKGLIQLFEPDSEESAPILQYPVELVLEALSHISYAKKGKLHRDVLGGILYAQLQSKVENTAQYVAEFLSALGQTGFVEYKNGIFRPYKDGKCRSYTLQTQSDLMQKGIQQHIVLYFQLYFEVEHTKCLQEHLDATYLSLHKKYETKLQAPIPQDIEEQVQILQNQAQKAESNLCLIRYWKCIP